MFDYDPDSAAFLAARSNLRADLLVWITARNRDTGAPEGIGFWTGPDHATFVIGGVARQYFGAGAMLAPDVLVYAQGPEIRRWSVTFSAVAPEVRAAYLTYEVRGAAFEAHQLLRQPITHAVVGTPRRIFLGEVEDVQARRAEFGQPSDVKITAASVQRRMTRTRTQTKSDESQQRRNNPLGPDRGRRFAVWTGQRKVSWGEKSS